MIIGPREVSFGGKSSELNGFSGKFGMEGGCVRSCTNCRSFLLGGLFAIG